MSVVSNVLAFSADELADARAKVMACIPLGVLDQHTIGHLKQAKLDLEAAIRTKQEESPTPLRAVNDADES